MVRIAEYVLLIGLTAGSWYGDHLRWLGV